MEHETVAVGAKYPVLPLRDIVVFPYMIVPLFVGREKSVKALESAMRDHKQVLLVTQKSAQQDEPTAGDLYDIGTLGTVLQLLKLPDGTVKVLVEGKQRARPVSCTASDSTFPYWPVTGAHSQVAARGRVRPRRPNPPQFSLRRNARC